MSQMYRLAELSQPNSAGCEDIDLEIALSRESGGLRPVFTSLFGLILYVLLPNLLNICFAFV